MTVPLQAAQVGTSASDTWEAFICYRRGDGATVARWVYGALLGFRAGSAIPGWRPLRVFLDEATERASLDFYERDIKPALEGSRCLVVVCTKTSDLLRADGSLNWQQREIQDFVARGGERPIIPIVVGARSRSSTTSSSK